MAAVATIKNAVKILSNSPSATRWIPRTNLKNATVAFEKKFLTGANGEKVFCGIDKVVTRADGQVIRGHYTPEGLLTGCLQKSSKGTIETTFGAQNYDKVVSIHTNAGESITRLGHKGRPQSFVDTFKRSDGIYAQGNFTDDYNRLRTEVQNPPKYPDWLQKIVNQWNNV